MFRLANKNAEKDDISFQLVIRKKCDLFPSYYPDLDVWHTERISAT